MEDEEWRQVKDFPAYEVSSLGRVRSNFSFYPKRVLKPRIDSRGLGYQRVSLRRNGLTYDTTVHILVAEAFLEERPSSIHEIDHEDSNPSNNQADNLKWATHGQNMIHSYSTGNRERPVGMRASLAKLTNEDVLEIRSAYKYRYTTYRALAKRYGISHHAIYDIINRITWAHI